MVDEIETQPETAPESPDAWTTALEDAGKWLKMLDHIETQYKAGERALTENRWAAAVSALEEVANNDTSFRDVEPLLAQARDGYRLAHWYEEANTHAQNGRWAEACRVWAQVFRHRSDYGNDDVLVSLLDALDALLVHPGRSEDHFETSRPQGSKPEREAREESAEQEISTDSLPSWLKLAS